MTDEATSVARAWNMPNGRPARQYCTAHAERCRDGDDERSREMIRLSAAQKQAPRGG